MDTCKKEVRDRSDHTAGRWGGPPARSLTFPPNPHIPKYNKKTYRPGRSLAMVAHALPYCSRAWASTRSSSSVHSPLLMLGSRWFSQRSRHCSCGVYTCTHESMSLVYINACITFILYGITICHLINSIHTCLPSRPGRRSAISFHSRMPCARQLCVGFDQIAHSG